jgi:hypothetical protein
MLIQGAINRAFTKEEEEEEDPFLEPDLAEDKSYIARIKVLVHH